MYVYRKVEVGRSADHGPTGEPSGATRVLLVMSQLITGQTDVTPHRTSRVHME